MRNFLQTGTNISLTAAAAAKSGEGVLIGKLFGVAAGDAAIGEALDIVTVGVFELPKVAAEAFAIGDPIYWATGTKLATKNTNSGANPLVGTAVKAAAASTGTVEVRLNGFVV